MLVGRRTLTGPQFQTNWCHRWPNDTLIRFVHWIQQRFENIRSIQIRPKASSFRVQFNRFAFTFRIAQKCAVRAEETVLEQKYQHLGAKFKAKRKLAVQLINAIQKENECRCGRLWSVLWRRVTRVFVSCGKWKSSLNPFAFDERLNAAHTSAVRV